VETHQPLESRLRSCSGSGPTHTATRPHLTLLHTVRGCRPHCQELPQAAPVGLRVMHCHPHRQATAASDELCHLRTQVFAFQAFSYEKRCTLKERKIIAALPSRARELVPADVSRASCWSTPWRACRTRGPSRPRRTRRCWRTMERA
jgi:hypothetical protein